MTPHSANNLSIPEILKLLNQSSNPSNDKLVIELVQRYLKTQKQDSTPFDARRWIEIMAKSPENVTPVKSEFQLIKTYETIRHPSLLFHLKQEKIPLHLANKFLTEIKAYHPVQKKHYTALGFSHEKGGFSIVNSKMTEWIGEPSLSFIRGQNLKTDTIHILHNFWDYLSLLAYIKKSDLPDDAIILNAYNCVSLVKAYIYQHGYKKAYTWMGNDSGGEKARRTLGTLFHQEDNLIHIAMNQMYQSNTSIGEWYQKQIEIQQ